MRASLFLLGILSGAARATSIFDFEFETSLDISFKEVSTLVVFESPELQSDEFFQMMGERDRHFGHLYEEEVSTYMVP